MRKKILTILVIAILISCNKTNTNNASKESSDIIETLEATSIKTEKEDEKKTSISQKTEDVENTTLKVNASEKQLSSTILNFQNCKSISEKRSDCRNVISKYINNVYGINDFKNKNNDHIIYDSIQPIISRSTRWKNIGSAVHQENLDKAVDYATDGGLALVIDTSESYGHIVIIQAGETKKSGSWGLKLPKVLSLSNHNPSKSFFDKTLAYAFKKSDDLQIYIRE